jgi:hypothetical protein
MIAKKRVFKPDLARVRHRKKWLKASFLARVRQLKPSLSKEQIRVVEQVIRELQLAKKNFLPALQG